MEDRIEDERDTRVEDEEDEEAEDEEEDSFWLFNLLKIHDSEISETLKSFFSFFSVSY